MDYWLEALETALDEEGVTLDKEVVTRLAKQMEFAHEMYGEATGAHCIPNPLHTEIKELTRKHNEEIKRMERKEDALVDRIREEVAARNHMSPENVLVSVRDGRVEARERR